MCRITIGRSLILASVKPFTIYTSQKPRNSFRAITSLLVFDIFLYPYIYIFYVYILTLCYILHYCYYHIMLLCFLYSICIIFSTSVHIVWMPFINVFMCTCMCLWMFGFPTSPANFQSAWHLDTIYREYFASCLFISFSWRCFSENDMGPEGAKALAGALTINRTLHTIGLQCMSILFIIFILYFYITISRMWIIIITWCTHLTFCTNHMTIDRIINSPCL